MDRPSGQHARECDIRASPYQDAEIALSDLEKFLHAEDFLAPLVRIGMAHAQFETIHPFLDGNGRIGRLLIAFFLCEKNILEKPVLYLSHYFKQNRLEYYDRLQAVRDEGDWEGWLKFFLKGVGSVASQATRTAREIVDLREHHRSLIAEYFGASGGKAMQVLEYLYTRPTVSVNQVRDLLKVSFANANNLIEKLASHGVLSEITGQSRNRVFLYKPYIELFSQI